MGRRKRRKKTPVRHALKDDSPLQTNVQDGIRAMQSADRVYLAENIRGHFGDNLDLDAALQQQHQHENRWDTERIRRRLDQNGVEFVGTTVLAKHLPGAEHPGSGPTKR